MLRLRRRGRQGGGGEGWRGILGRRRCNETVAACACNRRRWHRGPHECDCGGSWAYEHGEFVVISWPDFQGYGLPPRPFVVPPIQGYDVEDGVPIIRAPQQGRMSE